eukprot:s542_g12.t1
MWPWRLLLAWASQWLLPVSAEICVGILGPWTFYNPALMISMMAADLDFRKNWEPALIDRFGPPIIDLPGGLHPNASQIAFWIDSSHAQKDVGVAATLDMVLGNGGSPIVGLVGSALSSVSMPVATVAAVSSVPQISYASTSPVLSNKDTYPFFLRTVPPDNLLAIALWSWILVFNVPLVTVIYTMEAFGSGMFSSLETLARQAGQEQRLQSLGLRWMPVNFVEEEALTVVRAARQLGSRCLFILMVPEPFDPPSSCSSRDFLQAAAVGREGHKFHLHAPFPS